MAITINIGDKADQKKEPKIEATLNLKIRKSLDGNIFILEHDHLDITIMPKQAKVIAFAKNVMDTDIYPAQDRLFKFLIRKGLIKPDSVHGGNVYMSMEGQLETETNPANVLQLTVFNIGKFIEKELESFSIEKEYEKDREEALLNPDDEGSTDLGEVPHKDKQGQLQANFGYGNLGPLAFTGG